MRLGFDLTLEQAQKLIMTPELRQAIQMLQFTSLELNEYLDKQLETNPFLEQEVANDDFEDIDEHSEEKDDIDWEEVLNKYDDEGYTNYPKEEKDSINYENFVSYESSLKEQLLFQLSLLDCSRREKAIGEFIIDNIDENGYLMDPLEEIEKYMNTSHKEAEKVLNMIQSFEPIGVGARSLEECLTIQLKSKKIEDPNIYIIVEKYLEDVAANRLSKISKDLDLDLKSVQDICDYIRTLEPKPGRSFSGNSGDVKYVTPDVILRYIDGEYIIILNDITAPRLNINNSYKALMKKTDDPNISHFLNDKFNSALWIIRSIEQRRMTIYKVVESIIKHQRDFFKEGEKALKPLTLKEIADDIDVHESTVSRATNGKYMQTPRGLFELKYFFSTGISSDKGEISSTGIKWIIKNIIEKEDPKKPFSDQQITNILKERSIEISRRTVAKYRDKLNIPSSSVRRRY